MIVRKRSKCVRRDHNLDPHVEVVFLEIEVDDPSNFYQRLMIEVVQEDKRYIIKVTRCVVGRSRHRCHRPGNVARKQAPRPPLRLVGHQPPGGKLGLSRIW